MSTDLARNRGFAVAANLTRLAKGAAGLCMAIALTFTLFAIAGASSAEAARHKRSGAHKQHSVASDDKPVRAPYYGRKVGATRHAKSGRNVRVASLGTDTYTRKRSTRSVGESYGNVIWQASSGCLNGTLRSIISEVASMATVRVNSTCRDHGHNASVGGAKKSYHLSGDAVDFRVLNGNSSAVYAYLRSNSSVGGLKHYGGGLFHVDTGPRRSW